MVVPAPPPISDHNPSTPPGKVWQKGERETKEMQRKEEIVGEIYRPVQQAAEG